MFQSLIVVSLLSLGVANFSFENSDSLTEIEELRDTYSASYLTSKNTRLSFYYGAPVHYLDDGGYYQPIDTSFKRNKNLFVTKANSNNVTISDGYIRINNDICIDCFGKNCSVKDNCVYYENSSIESLATGVLMKKSICLTNKTSFTFTFSFLLLDDLNLETNDLCLTISNLYELSSPILVSYDNSLVVCPSSFFASRNDNRVSLRYNFQFDEPINQVFNITQQLMYTNFSGSGWIQHKYFQMGYSTTYSSTLLVGSSSLLDPYGNTPEYRVAFGLTLPNISSYTSVSGSFYFKKQSGTLSSVRVRRALNIDYSAINGTASYSTSFIENVSLGLGYSSVNITKKLIDVYSAGNNETDYRLNLIVSEIGSNATSYLYTNYSSDAPYFAIEFANYGDTQSAYTPSNNVNCCGYALWLVSGKDISDDLHSQAATEYNAETVIITIFFYYQNLFGIVDAYSITSYNTLIPSTYRRIAFRMRTDSVHAYGYGTNNNYQNDYHFMWQTSEGYWAEKLGFYGSYGVKYSVNAPDINSSWGEIDTPTYYNSRTFYFAIRTN